VELRAPGAIAVGRAGCDVEHFGFDLRNVVGKVDRGLVGELRWNGADCRWACVEVGVEVAHADGSAAECGDVAAFRWPRFVNTLEGQPANATHWSTRSMAAATVVERWFAELTTKWIKRGAHRSVPDLVASIRTWITNWNDNPKPFIWHKTADQILDSLAAYRQRINDSGH
jgi:hypothetical protein